MILALPNAIGIFGVIIVLATFLMVQLGRVNATSAAYQVANMVACSLIGVSLYFDFNLPSAIIQALWFLISGFGLMKNLISKRKSRRLRKN